jgi:DNA (cytosine-5)-methyltransferase 1
MDNVLKTIDLFCGCGGMSLGFQNAGFDIIAAYDNWTPAVEVYKKNFKHPIFQADLADPRIIDEIIAAKPDIIIGGPPCQDFSSAGHRNESLGRAALSVTYSEIVIKARPKLFVMENVPEIRKSEALKIVFENFGGAGYGLTSKVINASYCGVPQTRRRFFLVGCLDAENGFLTSYLDAHLADKPMSIYDYLGDSLGVEYYFRIPRSYNRRAVFSVFEPSVTIRGVDRPIPKNYKKHPNDLIEIGPLVRGLTPIERSYIQTFPNDFMFEASKSDLNQMIGNAVPVKLAEYVARAILEYCEGCLK